MLGRNPAPSNTVEKAVRFALDHHFERSSVVGWHDLATTAMERCLGGARPDEFEAEARRQGVLLKHGQATTREVLAEETRILDFAREGRGTMRPLASKEAFTLGTTDQLTLSAEQLALVRHVVTSPDRVVLVVGDAGTGKTRSVRAAFDALRCPVEMLAPSAAACCDRRASPGPTPSPRSCSASGGRRRCGTASSGSMRPDCCRSATCPGSWVSPASGTRESSSRATPNSTVPSCGAATC